MQTKVYSAFQARNNFGELLNLVYYQNIEVVIEKMNKPVARIVPIQKAKVNKQLIKFNPPTFKMGKINSSLHRSEIYDDYLDKKFLAK
ncbi:hypothetical protein CO083_00060 [Candidatus Roizmanbacteria bacterium CG_4_9_14_0_8_um_filter_34_12]|uniref:Antitoxin n=2 Tax=Candidatus Roizmaniibacteriota TaxID=1752723 RepID=A0A2H0C4D0_9BACT|nr:type II toxin-antitoxin system prevent-host-death family antitoxin [Candidatus Roizmanbacteria bacterium]PIP64158.1 MAG: hypothetical protein COW96_04080 [Candidatus Roizmanbacteria bacterium CG22_combo_CG10-13_8_21_14_all_33_16]PJB89750.1 MAG: hypothetical protein CO083_00060 [Candidatus Roizmanbacteria bacterium CG_4_9_14_0_8_um_filter_34_12]